MNAFQKMHDVALRHPCLLSEETAHPRFRRIVAGVASVIVTINTGYE